MNFAFHIRMWGASVAVFALFVSIATANILDWNVNDGFYSSASSWTRNPSDTNPPDADGVPDANDNIIFSRGGGLSYTVTFPGQTVLQPPADYFSATAAFGSNIVGFGESFSPQFGPSTFTTSVITMSGSTIAPAILSTSLSQLSTGTANIGFASGSTAMLNLNAGTLLITGANVEGLLVGGDGNGTLNVNPGAHVSITGANSSAVIGNSAGVSGTATVTGAGTTWTNNNDSPAANITVGDLGSGTFNVTAGAQINIYQGYIAAQNGSVGNVTVNGAGSVWTNRAELVVGTEGSGSLTISGGGQVIDGMSIVAAHPSASGTVNVTGTGSKWTQVGNLNLGSNTSSNGATGPGTVHIAAGGQIATGGDGFVGIVGAGTMTIDGVGSMWSLAGQMDVDEKGSVSITGSGKITSETAIVDGTLNINGSGSTLRTTDYISVGNAFTLNGSGPGGTLNALTGSHVTNRVTVIGDSRGSGEVVVGDAGTTWDTSDQLFVGLEGKGDMFVDSGAQLTSGSAIIGVSPFSSGHISIGGPGSKWTNSADVVVGGAGAGMLTAGDSGIIQANGLLSVGLNGNVEGNSHIVATVRNGGTVAPGLTTSFNPTDAMGTLHVDGEYTQTAAGTLQIQLASLTSFDKLAIDGHATIAGTLHASLFGGFTPAVGSAFQVLTATGGISGRFTLDFPTFGTLNGPRWVLFYSNSDVVLKLVNLPSGDYNGDGVVDAADYVVWRKSLGQTGLALPADGNHDHQVDQGDFDVWRAHFGQAVGSGSDIDANGTLPEPTALALLLMAAAHSFFHRRRASMTVSATR
jgi:T5SS/PEP-CTERM-associated repeat protein